MLAKYSRKTVMAIGAHPNDLELAIGGTLVRLAKQGTRVVMVVVTVPSKLESRIEEARQAAAVLGCEIRFLYPDRCLRVEDIKTYEMVGRIDKLVQELRPDAMFCHSENNFHRDHVLANNACAAVQRYASFDIFGFCPANCDPVQVEFTPRAYVDITKTVDAKMDAINLHVTQFACGRATEYYREVAKEYGRLAGVPYAEGLEVVRLSLG